MFLINLGVSVYPFQSKFAVCNYERSSPLFDDEGEDLVKHLYVRVCVLK